MHGLGVSDGGRTVVLWTVTGQIRHLEALTGLERFTVKMPTDEGMAAEIAPDGQTAVIWGREEESFQLWDGVRGKELHKLTGHGGALNTAAFSTDSKILMTSGQDGTVRLWNVATGKELLQLPGVTAAAMALSPDGKLVAVVTVEDELCLFEAASGKEAT